MTTVIRVTGNLADYITEKVEDGSYASPEDVVADALHRLREHDETAKLDWLRTAWREGLESGVSGPFDAEKITAQARQELEAGE